jgi:hypothetical protein
MGKNSDFKTFFLLLSATTLMYLPAWAGDVIPASSVIGSPEEKAVTRTAFTTEKCGDWEQFKIGDITLENNVWNKKAITDYHQCLLMQTRDGKTLFGWEWRWPSADDVLAYPEIIYGWKPWARQSTTTHLPERVTDIEECKVTYDIDMKKKGVGNLALDIWLTSEAVPAEKNISMELMIWLDNNGQIPDGSPMGQVTISGATWDFYKGNPPHAGWGSTAFLRHGKSHEGVLDVKEFLDFLVKNKYLSGDNYLDSIEFGNEICGGEGRTLFRDYRIYMKRK